MRRGTSKRPPTKQRLGRSPPQDYYATIYSAEIVNTLTNLMFAFLAVRGIVNCIQHDHDATFIGTFMGYGLVGLGSFCFHASLKCKSSLLPATSSPAKSASKTHGSLSTSSP